MIDRARKQKESRIESTSSPLSLGIGSSQLYSEDNFIAENPTMALSSSSKHAITLVSRLPVYDFLAPTLCRRLPIQRAFYQSRSLSNTQRCLQATSTEFTKASAPDLSSQPPKSTLEAADSSKPPPKPLTQAQRDFLASAVRTLFTHPTHFHFSKPPS